MIQLLAGDARDVLPSLAADSVQTVVTSPPYYALRSYLPDGHPDKGREIGSEATPDEYLATLVAVFREVRRVLRPDGTVWCNMGDSYASNGPGSWGSSDKSTLTTGSKNGAWAPGKTIGTTAPRSSGAKPKDLLMMPARLALALQADGWWLRSDIIIAKKNPMPESCRDRPTSAHEHVFLLTKKSRYYFDCDAVREPQSEGTFERFGNGNAPRKPGIKQGGSDRKTASFDALTPDAILPNGRNIRNVWDISTEAFKGSHFATMPTSVVERCIRAGTSEKGCCPQCGAPWYRVTEKSYVAPRGNSVIGAAKGLDESNGWSGYPVLNAQSTTIGWHPTCACDKPGPVVPCTVLDPFAGAGTTLLVADRLQRDAIGVELNPDYTRMAMQRCQDDAPLFTSFPPAEPPEDERMRDLFREAAD